MDQQINKLFSDTIRALVDILFFKLLNNKVSQKGMIKQSNGSFVNHLSHKHFQKWHMWLPFLSEEWGACFMWLIHCPAFKFQISFWAMQHWILKLTNQNFKIWQSRLVDTNQRMLKPGFLWISLANFKVQLLLLGQPTWNSWYCHHQLVPRPFLHGW